MTSIEPIVSTLMIQIIISAKLRLCTKWCYVDHKHLPLERIIHHSEPNIHLGPTMCQIWRGMQIIAAEIYFKPPICQTLVPSILCKTC